MTNSETQTEPRKKSRKRGGKASGARKQPAPAAVEPAPADSADDAVIVRLDKKTARVVAWSLFILLLAGGWLAIWQINRWHFASPVLFLWAGWLGVLLTARFLWTAGMSAAYDDDTGVDDDEFWKPVGAKDELLHEKRSLLKAIKEIEFDREMGKLSDEDAAEMTRYYRARAIEVIKALEGGAEDRELSLDEKIEREVKARLSVASASASAKPKAARAKAAEPEAAEADAEPEAAQAGAEPEAAEADAEPEAAEADAEPEAAEADAEPRASAEVGS